MMREMCGRRDCGAGAMDGDGLELRDRARTSADTAMDWDCPTQAWALKAVAETIVLRAGCEELAMKGCSSKRWMTERAMAG